MSLKQETLSLLEQNRGNSVSGEHIARSLGVSRAAVWKAVGELRDEGHAITSSTRVGYRLLASSDVLSSEGIMPYLDDSSPISVYCHPSVSSTNRVAKQMALDGAPHKTVVVAGEQTEGRGRNGRSFFSPRGTGIYLSVILRPDMDSGEVLLVTSAASVAVCRAIDDSRDGRAGIKWVNDIIVDGRKVCGILTEGISGFENGRIESLVVGIGVNVITPAGGFPSDIAGIAGALFDHNAPPDFSRNRLVARILNQLFAAVDHPGDKVLLDEYRERSVVLGKPVRVVQGNKQYDAVAKSIDDAGALLVMTGDGSIRVLHSGEVTLRPQPGTAWNTCSSGSP